MNFFGKPVSLGLAAIVALVALRLGLGWHFYQEGAKKVREGTFTSAHFFRQAKGPLAEFYKSQIPDNFGDYRLDHNSVAETADDWKALQEFAIEHFGFDEEQTREADAILTERTAQLEEFFEANRDELKNYFRDLEDVREKKQRPASAVPPHEQRWLAQRETKLQGQAIGWTKTVDAIRTGLETDLNSLADGDQWRAGPVSLGENYSLRVDPIVMWLTLLVGICLLLGLFTRVAALFGALFLFGVMATQPPWVAGAEPIYYQTVEFLALLVVAALGAGQWAGLDYLLGWGCRRYCSGCCQSQKKS